MLILKESKLFVILDRRELQSLLSGKGTLSAKERTGCPSTPIQGQPNLHDDRSYIYTMRNVKNFIQEINHIHN